MAAKKKFRNAYKGDTNPFGLTPAWVFQLCAGLLWGLTVLAALLLGAAHIWPLGRMTVPGGRWAAEALELWGESSWWLAVFTGLTGWQLFRQRRGAPLMYLAGGGLWVLLGCSAWLSLIPRPPGTASWGGEVGLVMAQALAPWGGWLVPAGLTLGGLALWGWALRPLWRGLGVRGARQPVIRRPAAAPPAAAPLEEAPILGEPEPSSPETPAGPGPRIKPRVPPAPLVDPPRQEKLGFSRDDFKLPPVELLQAPPPQQVTEQEATLKQNSRLVGEKLADFGVKGEVVEVAPGPVVTMYEFKPAPGVKISKVSGLADDLAMNLRARSIRIVAPIPGKAVIGIEIPNQARETVYLREIISCSAFARAAAPLSVALGKDILGGPVITDLARMPHLLIAGATGAGKSVFINTMVLSILYKSTPRQVRLLMVDPKRIELSTYNDIPHLLYPIITEPKEATAGLRWALGEMERRYELMAQSGVRNIKGYNQALEAGKVPPPEPDGGPLPYIVVIIDELADLMMVSSKEVEALITRLAQMARAAGIHLVLATQRPSVDVITGLIKANFPARISFKVTSRADSRVIMDQQGAEHLLGMGDMLFSPPGTMGLTRIHGAYVSDREIEEVVDFLKEQGGPEYDESVVQSAEEGGDNGLEPEENDEQYGAAVSLVMETGQASISFVQRRLRVGYNRAARMIEQMEREGIVGPSDGSRPRQVLARQ